MCQASNAICVVARQQSASLPCKTVEVREGLFRIALEAPDASCRAITDRFNRDHVEQGWSVGKTYVAEFLREFKE